MKDYLKEQFDRKSIHASSLERQNLICKASIEKDRVDFGLKTIHSEINRLEKGIKTLSFVSRCLERYIELQEAGKDFAWSSLIEILLSSLSAIGCVQNDTEREAAEDKIIGEFLRQAKSIDFDFEPEQSHSTLEMVK